jgi:S-DNA-T family DNA segregation ATPase FtsK/SpoIIIE
MPKRKKTSTNRKPVARRATIRHQAGSPLDNLLKRLPRFGGKPASKSAKRGKKAPPPQPGMSLDRKLDIVGILLAILGLLTLITLLTPTRGLITGAWVDLVRSIFGWGGYVLPLGLILIGVWLIVRNFESIPTLALERVIGISLLFINLLLLLQWVAQPESPEASYALARSGRGGGLIGAFLFESLYGALGIGGLIIAYLGWVILGLAMTLDVGVMELFGWLPPAFMRLQDAWDDYLARRRGQESPADFIAPGVAASPLTPANPVAPEQAAPVAHGQPAAVGKQPEIRLGVARDDVAVREWKLPSLEDMLFKGIKTAYNEERDKERKLLIEETLASFGAPAHVVEVNRGPAITQFGVEPDFIETRNGRTRVRVGKISALADDLALALAASRIRIQAPVPGKGYVGIEVPNEEITMVALRDILESSAIKNMKSELRFALGQDVAGHAVAADLRAMPHLLVAGATGAGKSVCVNGIIAALLVHNTPARLRMIMVDPKRVELTGFNGIPHLLAPVVTEIDRVVGVLQWVTREMDGRYQKFADLGARNLDDYNLKLKGEGGTPLPYLVMVIDELADLMMVAPDQTERHITRLAQLARATGIHLIISTQRPSVDVVTGLIKANFPARIAFAVASGTDSRVILDHPGAERLLGRGDMLFQAPDAPAPVRLQGVFVSDEELLNIVTYWRQYAGTTATAPLATNTPSDAPPSHVPLKQLDIWEEMKDLDDQAEGDPIYREAVALIRRRDRASISMLQRRLRIGYTRAARIVDQMEAQGIIGPATGNSAARQVLDYGESGPPAEFETDDE